MHVFVTGGTGLIGSVLVKRLRERGDDVVVLTRRPAEATTLRDLGAVLVAGDPMKADRWMDSVASCDAVVHLAGEGIFNRRWNDEFKQRMRDSRVISTHNIVAALARQPRRGDGSPKVLISGSAVGYYGDGGDREFVESSPPASDFLAQLCVDWEKAAQTADPLGVRVVLLRTGVVLSRDGGALKKMLTPFKMFVGGPVGSGKQYMAWIHIEDMVGVILFALDQSTVVGPANASAPTPVTNRAFSTALGKVLGRPSFMPAPAFALRLTLGEVASVVTGGQRAVPRQFLDRGYTFRFTDVEAALADLLVAK